MGDCLAFASVFCTITGVEETALDGYEGIVVIANPMNALALVQIQDARALNIRHGSMAHAVNRIKDGRTFSSNRQYANI
jgi:hypothetical protein